MALSSDFSPMQLQLSQGKPACQRHKRLSFTSGHGSQQGACPCMQAPAICPGWSGTARTLICAAATAQHQEPHLQPELCECCDMQAAIRSLFISLVAGQVQAKSFEKSQRELGKQCRMRLWDVFSEWQTEDTPASDKNWESCALLQSLAKSH